MKGRDVVRGVRGLQTFGSVWDGRIVCQDDRSIECTGLLAPSPLLPCLAVTPLLPSADLVLLDNSRTLLTPRPDRDLGVALLDYLTRFTGAPSVTGNQPGILEVPLYAEASPHTIAVATALLSFFVSQCYSGERVPHFDLVRPQGACLFCHLCATWLLGRGSVSGAV